MNKIYEDDIDWDDMRTYDIEQLCDEESQGESK